MSIDTEQAEMAHAAVRADAKRRLVELIELRKHLERDIDDPGVQSHAWVIDGRIAQCQQVLADGAWDD